ncbi:MAG: glucokinase [Candidatus Thermoplasmatota archaeon]
MLDCNIKKINEDKIKNKFKKYVLGADIGGTNTNLCIAGVNNSKPVLLYSLNFKTQKLNSIIPAIQKTLSYSKNKYSIENINVCCIGTAGLVKTDQKPVDLTNAKLTINSEKLKENTKIKSVTILNDFQIIGFGINLLDHKNKNDIITVRKKINDHQGNKAVVGAGTGLGKTLLIHDKNFGSFIPIPSEGGHADFPAFSDIEQDIVDFVIKSGKTKKPVTYEDLLSGKGIERIYSFLREKNKDYNSKFTEEIDDSKVKPYLISKYRKKDEVCRKTFDLFTRFYARCAKNFVLDTMSTGGLYLAGGIAEKNPEIFEKQIFIEEFEKAYQRSDLLKKIPIYVITNYEVSLYGACLGAIYYTSKENFWMT